MKTPFDRARLVAAGCVLLAGTVLIANGTRFSDYTPLPSSAGPVAVVNEDMPITFGNPDFSSAPSLTETPNSPPTNPTPATGT